MNIAPSLSQYIEIINNYKLYWIDENIIHHYNYKLSSLIFHKTKQSGVSHFEFKAIKIALINYYKHRPAFARMVDENYEYCHLRYNSPIHILVTEMTTILSNERSPHFKILLKDKFGTEQTVHCYWNTRIPYPIIEKMDVSFSL
jgi:hypothetical protein